MTTPFPLAQAANATVKADQTTPRAEATRTDSGAFFDLAMQEGQAEMNGELELHQAVPLNKPPTDDSLPEFSDPELLGEDIEDDIDIFPILIARANSTDAGVEPDTAKVDLGSFSDVSGEFESSPEIPGIEAIPSLITIGNSSPEAEVAPISSSIPLSKAQGGTQTDPLIEPRVKPSVETVNLPRETSTGERTLSPETAVKSVPSNQTTVSEGSLKSADQSVRSPEGSTVVGLKSGEKLIALDKRLDSLAVPASSPAPPSSAAANEVAKQLVLKNGEVHLAQTEPDVSRAPETTAEAARSSQSPATLALSPTITPQPALAANIAPILTAQVERQKVHAVDPDLEVDVIAPASTAERQSGIQSQTSAIFARPEMPRQIAAQMAQALRGPTNGPVEITLQPEELGRVRMTISTSEAGISINVAAERNDTYEMMRRHAASLSKELVSMGFDSVDLSFEQAGQNGTDRRERDETAPGQTFASGEDSTEIGVSIDLTHRTDLDQTKALDKRI